MRVLFSSFLLYGRLKCSRKRKVKKALGNLNLMTCKEKFKNRRKEDLRTESYFVLIDLMIYLHVKCIVLLKVLIYLKFYLNLKISLLQFKINIQNTIQILKQI